MQEIEKIDKIKLLLIDDDENIRYMMKKTLGSDSFRVFPAQDGKTGIQLCTQHWPDIIIMDIRLCDMKGTDLIYHLRKWTNCPIMIISETNDYHEKVLALNAGADDYMEKPFQQEELVARVHSLLRRSAGYQVKPYHVRDLQIDFARRMVLKGGNQIHLPPAEYRILEFLAQNAGKVVTYKMLLEKMWGPYALDDNRILRVNMTNIRRKIEDIPAKPEYLFTEPRIGYRMLESN